ncbi:MAG TPA: hypothetical protein PKB11_13415 [Desulfovibrio sp.]|uniref:hypothetical protein n=1 Tax=Desulfovibrio sp. TaxID=885 RepID=UPI002B744B45|nr:hypothetical protein [Desulfovibrio sp.]HMM39752.1 hypothetical protein [Desulfovibrio sp.]
MRRILLVDGDSVNRDYLICLLDPFGTCVQAHDGRCALALLRDALDQGEPFDAVVIGRSLSGPDGPDLARRIDELQQLAGIPRGNRVRVLLLVPADAPPDPAFLETHAVHAAIPVPGTRRLFMDMLS